MLWPSRLASSQDWVTLQDSKVQTHCQGDEMERPNAWADFADTVHEPSACCQWDVTGYGEVAAIAQKI